MPNRPLKNETAEMKAWAPRPGIPVPRHQAEGGERDKLRGNLKRLDRRSTSFNLAEGVSTAVHGQRSLILEYLRTRKIYSLGIIFRIS